MRLESGEQCSSIVQGRRFRNLTLAAFSAATLTTAPVWSQPHSVSGVAANDVLNIRANIDHTLDVGGSEVVGVILHDAVDVMVTGISVDVDGTMWREVDYKGTVGWVNSSFLKPTSLLLETPESLHCGGTEPFWGVEVDENDSTFFSPDVEEPVKLDYLRFEPGIGRTDLWGHYLGSTDGAYSLTVIVRYTEACTDGMSDLTYDYEAILLGLGTTGAPAHGCCSIKR